MKHIVCYPSADLMGRGLQIAKLWMDRGYHVLIMAKDCHAFIKSGALGLHIIPEPAEWPGYYGVINDIAKYAFGLLNADVCTFIGDDMLPDLKRNADQIARLYLERFSDGYGVMQGTGDQQGEIIDGQPNSGRICGSPTFGRGWHERAFQGSGGFPVGYRSFYADEVLKVVAERLGVLWQNPDVTVDHAHWSFGRTRREWWHERAQQNWEGDKARFLEQQVLGFPGCESLIEARNV